MQTRKLSQDDRRWLSPWHLAIFATGAVVGAALGRFYGVAYTSGGIIVTCWLAALLMIAMSGSRVYRSPHATTRMRRGRTPMAVKPAGATGADIRRVRRSGGAAGTTVADIESARRARLRSIVGGKSEPPSRAS